MAVRNTRAGSATPNGFRWHVERRKRLLRDHPEVARLVGSNAWTAVFVFGLVAVQLGLAFALRDSAWWLVLLVAYAAGTFISHALGVLIHDCAHDLVFESTSANKALSIVANIPLVFPAAIDFREKHLEHHGHLGEEDGADTQAPVPWHFTFVTSPWRAVIWHCFAPILMHTTKPRPENRWWLVLNIVANLGVAALLFWAWGAWSLLFLGASGWFAFGPHPVGMRRYGEHLTLSPSQPTTSYYGPYNWLSFNVGYHVEHHDLPSVPWNRVKAVHRAAPELYQPLESVQSWNELLVALFTKPGEGPERYVFGAPASWGRNEPKNKSTESELSSCPP